MIALLASEANCGVYGGENFVEFVETIAGRIRLIGVFFTGFKNGIAAWGCKAMRQPSAEMEYLHAR